jgi:hypothetical protein
MPAVNEATTTTDAKLTCLGEILSTMGCPDAEIEGHVVRVHDQLAELSPETAQELSALIVGALVILFEYAPELGRILLMKVTEHQMLHEDTAFRLASERAN